MTPFFGKFTPIFFLSHTQWPPFFPSKSYTECPLFSFSGRHIPITFTFECPWAILIQQPLDSGNVSCKIKCTFYQSVVHFDEKYHKSQKQSLDLYHMYHVTLNLNQPWKILRMFIFIFRQEQYVLFHHWRGLKYKSDFFLCCCCCCCYCCLFCLLSCWFYVTSAHQRDDFFFIVKLQNRKQKIRFIYKQVTISFI